MLVFAASCGVAMAQTGASDGGGGSSTSGTGGPIRLRQPNNLPLPPAGAASAPRDFNPLTQQQQPLQPVEPPPSEFELFVQRRAGIDLEEQQRKAMAGLPIGATIRRFGAELMTPQPGDAAIDAAPLVPPDYLIKPGDELLVTLWGSVDADLRLPVDRNGRITLPRVGPALVAGVRYADLPGVISQRIGQVFRNFQLSVALGQLRGQRIYVTGFVARPGAYTVNSLATVAQALLQAGGPTAAGSYRQIELRRGSQRVASLDLYDILLRGDRSSDATLQGEDVIHVGAVGTQVGLIGSVNRPAVFELKPGESLGDVLAMAGGFSAVADTTRLAIERLDERASVRIVEVALPEGARSSLRQGDVLRAFSAVEVVVPVQRQNKRVRVEGEVARPGEYVLPPQSTIADALRVAGGITASAYLFGTEFSRESVRLTQQQNYERALRDLETDLARNNSTRRTSGGEEVAAQTARDTANTRLIASLRALRPTGRIVLQLPSNGGDLPPLALEDGDRLFVPPQPTSVGVFGSVFNGGSYLYTQGRSVGDYLALAGGPTRGADASSTFVIRANGSVVSNQQQRGWLGRGGDFGGVVAEPGDTVFVPEEQDKTTFTQAAKDWTQILYQFGLGIAGIVSASR